MHSLQSSSSSGISVSTRSSVRTNSSEHSSNYSTCSSNSTDSLDSEQGYNIADKGGENIDAKTDPVADTSPVEDENDIPLA